MPQLTFAGSCVTISSSMSGTAQIETHLSASACRIAIAT